LVRLKIESAKLAILFAAFDTLLAHGLADFGEI
jgi:hypothetical protein